jgi:DHA1 family bicyclomycin/chloramphenicol resistance-like MFS transporter
MATLLPFVMIEDVGLSPTLFGLSMIMQSGSFLTGSLVMRQLLPRMEAHRLVPFGMVLIAIAGVLLATILRVAEPSFLGVMGPIAIFAFGMAFISPSMQTGALAHFPDIAGSAAALMGFFQMGGGLLGSAVSAALGRPVFSLATIIPTMIVIAIASHYGFRAVAGPQQMLDSVADRIVKPHAPAE